MIVIDIGSATYGGDESIPYLVETFQPTILYGFDPNGEQKRWMVGNTHVITERSAAWTYTGTIGFVVAGLGGHVDDRGPKTPCFDLASFVADISHDQEIVLKMDAEGAEYTLMPHLSERGVDLRLKLAIVEWHCEECGLGGNGRHRENCPSDKKWWWERRNNVEEMMRCEMQEWNR